VYTFDIDFVYIKVLYIVRVSVCVRVDQKYSLYSHFCIKYTGVLTVQNLGQDGLTYPVYIKSTPYIVTFVYSRFSKYTGVLTILNLCQAGLTFRPHINKW
jgi:hypothetical protein